MGNRDKRRRKIRKKIHGTTKCPRLSIYRSLKYISAQLINDDEGKTIISATSKNITGKNKIEKAKKVGEKIAKKAKAKKISKIRFDRGGFSFHGQIKALADGARSAGLKF